MPAENDALLAGYFGAADGDSMLFWNLNKFNKYEHTGLNGIKNTYHFRNSAICNKDHMEKASYNTQPEDRVGFLDWNHNLSSCRITIKLYFLIHTLISSKPFQTTQVLSANQCCQQWLLLLSRGTWKNGI
jgi:hypothetical protein